ncbi:hypothetical protein [Paraburkholderia sp. MM5477-R1]|uniref:hypothetical protein n=1 Tax=Paraburkholderia sp. MM5477-R1 TaxID=2991062 RepID=UPI003D1FE884
MWDSLVSMIEGIAHFGPEGVVNTFTLGLGSPLGLRPPKLTLDWAKFGPPVPTGNLIRDAQLLDNYRRGGWVTTVVTAAAPFGAEGVAESALSAATKFRALEGAEMAGGATEPWLAGLDETSEALGSEVPNALAPENPLDRVESANAERYAFGDSPKTYEDPFTSQKSPVVGAREARSGANTFDRATIAESGDYNQQTAPKHLGGEGKVGIQRPGVVNADGPDSIVFDPETGKIQVRDTKGRGPGGSFPQSPSRSEVARKWGTEIGRAIDGDLGDPVGGVRTGDAALDQRIRDAWHEGKWEYVQVNVRLPELPPKGPLEDLGPF